MTARKQLLQVHEQVCDLYYQAVQTAYEYRTGGDELLALQYTQRAEAYDTCITMLEAAIQEMEPGN